MTVNITSKVFPLPPADLSKLRAYARGACLGLAKDELFEDEAWCKHFQSTMLGMIEAEFVRHGAVEIIAYFFAQALAQATSHDVTWEGFFDVDQERSSNAALSALVVAYEDYIKSRTAPY